MLAKTFRSFSSLSHGSLLRYQMNRGPPNNRLPSNMNPRFNEATRLKLNSLYLKRNQSASRSAYYNITLVCVVCIGCFAGLPLYRTFCEHTGITGDSDKKKYQFDGKPIKNVRKYRVVFQGVKEGGSDWQFEPVEREVIMGVSETAIVFYRLFNNSDKPVVGFSAYNIVPEEANLFFSKIQCFCFNQQLVNPKEELLLPLFFYLEPEINDEPVLSNVDVITVMYSFNRSANQDLAKFAADQIQRVKRNKQELSRIRAKNLKMSLPEYEQYLENQEKQGDRIVEEARMAEIAREATVA